MGYKFVGENSTDYGTSEFYFASHGSPKSLRSGDWIDVEDIDYMVQYHPALILEVPGEGPGSSTTDGSTEGTTVDFKVFTSGRPPIPPAGTYRMFMRGDGKLYVLNSEGRDMPLEFDAFRQTWGDQ
jgi:hypothetical protein